MAKQITDEADTGWHEYLHYWNLRLCRVPRKLGKGCFKLGKDFAEYCTRLRVFGVHPSGKQKFAEFLPWALGKVFAELQRRVLGKIKCVMATRRKRQVPRVQWDFRVGKAFGYN